jgi:phosphoglycolate phosphatase
VLAAVLFDFDGTLVDTRSASWVLFQQTNLEFALGIETREQFFALFTHNIYEGLTALCGDAARGAAAAAHLMALMREHYDPPLVPGMAALVRELAADFALTIVSSNTHATLTRLLARDNLAPCFQAILAGDIEPSKTRAITRFLSERAYAPDEVVLITDTTGDILEAQRAGIAAYGVCWGIHDAAALRAAGAIGTALHPDELKTWFYQQRTSNGGGTQCRATP